MLLLATALALAADPADPPGIDWSAAGDEVAEVLSGYLQVDTINPPGNETEGARYLASVLEREGIPSQILEYAPGRGSLVARLEGDGRERPLCLLSHIDVVPVEADRWPADRGGLSGAIADGYVWGRGALDMKGMGALELMTLVHLKRAGVKLKRDVILLAVADEEDAGQGAQFLAREHWGEIGCSHLVNEGGLGMRDVLFEGQSLYGISVAEKGVMWLKLTAHGPAGHGSRPDPGQAPPTLVRALAQLEQWSPRPRFHPALIELFDAVGDTRTGLERAVLKSPFLLRTLLRGRLMGSSATRALLTDTVNITNFHAGVSPNVVPGEASAILDCRLLPGTDPDAFLATLKETIGDSSITIDVLHTMSSNASPTDDPLFRALATRAVEGRTDVAAGPVLSPGFTDSIYLRPLGVNAYGFVPFEVTLEEAETMHGHGERVPIQSLRDGLRILYRAVHDVAAG